MANKFSNYQTTHLKVFKKTHKRWLKNTSCKIWQTKEHDLQISKTCQIKTTLNMSYVGFILKTKIVENIKKYKN